MFYSLFKHFTPSWKNSLVYFLSACALYIGGGLIQGFYPAWVICISGLMAYALLMMARTYHVTYEENMLLRALHTYSANGIIFFNEKGEGFWPNQSFYNFFHLAPPIRLDLNFFDTLLHNHKSWEALSRLKIYSQRLEEGEETLEFYLRQKVVQVKISVKKTFFKGSIWFIEKSSEKINPLAEKKAIFSLLDSWPTPVLVLAKNQTIFYTNQSFQNWLNYNPAISSSRSIEHYLPNPPHTWQIGQLLTFQIPEDGTKKKSQLTQIIPFANTRTVCLILKDLTNFVDPCSILTFFDTFPGSVLTLDNRGYIRAVNKTFYSWIDQKHPLNKPLTSWIEEQNRKDLTKFLQQIRHYRPVIQPLETVLQGKITKEILIYGTYVDQDHSSGTFFLFLLDRNDFFKGGIPSLEAQKFQALGQLAVGITHDFNNLLTVMLGFCDLLLQRHSSQDPSFPDIVQIQKNAQRASHLVRQLLLFARPTQNEAIIFDVCQRIEEMSMLLRRLISPTIELRIVPGTKPHCIHCDPGQFEQVIMNLSINGRDAMPNGGILTIKTRQIVLEETITLYKTLLKPGNYIVIDVSDTGSGIPSDNIERIFDPFFSTKDPGKGTGLGLATVSQILQKISGGISVKTKQQVGSTFSVYIPSHSAEKQPLVLPLKSEEKTESLLGHESILIVEDEDPIRLFASRALRNQGYAVLEARNGKQALKLLKEESAIDLIITDVIMPRIDGPTLANQALAMKPNLKVLFVSGYPEELIQNKVYKDFLPSITFLSKPFNLNTLLQKVHTIFQ